jgi:hypothetical protein
MRAVVTIAVGQGFGEMAALTHPGISAYARRIGADFVSLNAPSQNAPSLNAPSLNAPCAAPHFQKFRLASLLDLYDRILYMDTDIVVTDGCPDIFEVVPEDAFGAWFPNPMIPGRFADRIARVQEVLGDIGWRENYFNSGVMVVSRLHQPIFENPGDYADDFFEQTQLNYRVQKGRYRTVDIGYRWNHTSAVYTERRLQSHFIHYAGWAHIPGLPVIEQIRADLRTLGRL